MSKAKEKAEKLKPVIERVRVCCPGKISALERSKKYAKNLLSKVIPFEVWCNIEPRSKFEKEAYWVIVNELKKIAKEGYVGEIRCRNES